MSSESEKKHIILEKLLTVAAVVVIAMGVTLWFTMPKAKTGTPSQDAPSDAMQVDSTIRKSDGTPQFAAFQRTLADVDMSGFNVLFVSFDTVRADHLGCYGYTSAETPRLDTLAGRGALFEHAVASVPSTLPSHSTMMTGLEAPSHGVRTNAKFKLDPKVTTLAEVLGDRGYATGAVVATFVLDSQFQLDQGFEFYHDEFDRDPKTQRHMPKRAERITEIAIGWIDSQSEQDPDRPWLFWAHYFDPHAPYDPPEPYASRFPDAPYDGEIAYADDQFGKLLDHLDDTNLLSETIIVVVADHGEGLGEHGEETHSRLIYDTTVHVPLIISVPALWEAPHRIGDVTVGTVDLTPTILAMLDVESELVFDGVDLTSANITPDRAMYIETMAPLFYHGWASLHGLRRIDGKFIDAPLPEYFNLLDDPDELHNLLETDASAGAPLRELLSERMAAWTSLEEVVQTGPALNKQQVDHLAALGYVDSTASEEDKRDERPDPKDIVPVFRLIRTGDFVTMQEQAWQTLSQASLKPARYRQAMHLATSALFEAGKDGRSPAAIRTMLAYRKDGRALPSRASLVASVALAHHRLGRSVDAWELLNREGLLAMSPDDVQNPDCLAVQVLCEFSLGRTDRAKLAAGWLADVAESAARHALADEIKAMAAGQG